MSIENLQRVLWRLRKIAKTEHPTNKELERAVMYECGTSPPTYRYTRKALITLGWIKAYTKKRISLNGGDIDE